MPESIWFSCCTVPSQVITAVAQCGCGFSFTHIFLFVLWHISIIDRSQSDFTLAANPGFLSAVTSHDKISSVGCFYCEKIVGICYITNPPPPGSIRCCDSDLLNRYETCSISGSVWMKIGRTNKSSEILDDRFSLWFATSTSFAHSVLCSCSL